MQECEVVQLCLRGFASDLNFFLKANTVPVICSPLQSRGKEVANKTNFHLRGLKLADNPVDTDRISKTDILVTGEVR